MGLFYTKDEFGYKVFRPSIIVLLNFLPSLIIFIGIFLILYIKCGCTHTVEIPQIQEEKNEKLEWTIPEPKENIKEPPVIIKPEKKNKKKSLGYRWEIEYVKTFEHIKLTCYSRYDSPKERRGVYANDDMTKLPIFERRIQDGPYKYHDWTVALPFDMDIYHRELTRWPNGEYTHKYRFHIPSYNRGARPVNKVKYSYGRNNATEDLKQIFDREFYSVPRDRMKPIHKTGIADALFTGCEPSVKARQGKWNNPRVNMDLYEIVIYEIFSDGTRRKVK